MPFRVQFASARNTFGSRSVLQPCALRCLSPQRQRDFPDEIGEGALKTDHLECSYAERSRSPLLLVSVSSLVPRLRGCLSWVSCNVSAIHSPSPLVEKFLPWGNWYYNLFDPPTRRRLEKWSGDVSCPITSSVRCAPPPPEGGPSIPAPASDPGSSIPSPPSRFAVSPEL
ncbi:uncharacterized protein LOC124158167 [Ischnura elegans]|uniref:uncharacterized protein LOC124158167 n=1 Tax=Ischnura elegans TaxID=197161 RepID=UPI001ED8733A|nr:uncharacterized protein LOC124158167 [Ischnura elegans]